MPSQLVNASARRRLEPAMATGYPLPGLAIYRITLVLLSASLLTVYAFSWPHCSRSHIYTFIMYTVYCTYYTTAGQCRQHVVAD